jgi:DNA-binding GntR family transcriptional regulator
MIVGHQFEPGLRLNVEKITREIGVSRIPVWEAIRRLQQEGIVYTIPNRGAFLSENSLERSLEIMEVRVALDRIAGRRACDQITERILNKLAHCLPDQLRAIETANIGLYCSADLRFHSLIYQASGNSYLNEIFESIGLHILSSRLEFLRILPFRIFPLLYLGHQEIIKGLTNRDPEQVEAAVTRHVELVMNYVKDMLRSPNERKEMVRCLKEKSPPIEAPKEGTGSRKPKSDLLNNPR